MWAAAGALTSGFRWNRWARNTHLFLFWCFVRYRSDGWQGRKKPGEKKTMKFELERDVLAIRNVHNEFAAEPAEVTVWIRPDSAHGSEALLQILP